MMTVKRIKGGETREVSDWTRFRSFINGVSSSLAFQWAFTDEEQSYYEIITEPILGFNLVHYLENTASADLTDWVSNYRDLPLRPEGTKKRVPVNIVTDDGESIFLSQSAEISLPSKGMPIGAKSANGNFRFLSLDRSERLQVTFAAEPPDGTIPVFVGTSSAVPGVSLINTDYTIPSGSTLVLQRLAGGSEGQPDRTSRVDLLYYPSGTTGPGQLLRNGFCSNNNFEFTLNYTFIGNGTRVIRLVRARMDGGERQVTGFWDGFLE